MKIRFVNNDTNVESENFIQATIDFFYEEYAKRYVKKFIGQTPFIEDNNLYSFLEENAQNLFLVEFISEEDEILDSLPNGRLFLISKDIINNYSRIEIRQENVQGSE